jgi:hypothetical protein
MRLKHASVFVSYLTLVILSSSAQAIVTERLSFLQVSVNGVDMEIKTNQKIELIRGDELKLLYAALDGESKQPDLINFVGFRGEGPQRAVIDDREKTINTGDLNRGWSLDGKGQSYRIEAKSGNKLNGEIFVSVTQPELRNLSLEINGKAYEMMAGQTLEVAPDDPIRVLSVKTNVNEIDDLVRVEFVKNAKNKLHTVELKLLYRTYAFASIYLKNVTKPQRGN